MTTGAQIESLTWNTASGVTEALTTIVGQNFAAGKLRRVYTAFCRALSFTLIIGVLGTILFVFWGEEIFALIVPEEAAYKAGAVYLGIVGLSQAFMMLEITAEGLFYGLGRTYLPAAVSIVGTYLRIPMVLLLRLVGLGYPCCLVGDLHLLDTQGAHHALLLPALETPHSGGAETAEPRIAKPSYISTSIQF